MKAHTLHELYDWAKEIIETHLMQESITDEDILFEALTQAGYPSLGAYPAIRSWTAVLAMPIRIARKLGWRPPVPPPRWEDPKGAVRVLVADPRGIREEALANTEENL